MLLQCATECRANKLPVMCGIVEYQAEKFLAHRAELIG